FRRVLFRSAQRGRSLADVDRDREHAPGDDAHQLRHRAVVLKMQAPDHAAHRARLVVLHELVRDAERAEAVPPVRLDKPASVIGEDLRRDDLHRAIKIPAFDLKRHAILSLPANGMNERNVCGHYSALRRVFDGTRPAKRTGAAPTDGPPYTAGSRAFGAAG